MHNIMNILNRSLVLICQKRAFRTSSCLNVFWERNDKGGYNTSERLPPFKDRMKIGLDELKKEIILWKNEVKERLESDPVGVYRPGEVDVVWKFNGKESLDKWTATSDKDHNEGFSHCTLTTTKEGKALFSGEIVKRVPLDGRVKRAGYCNMKSHRTRKSFKRDAHLNWTPYNMLVIRLRGDGRNYLLNIHTKGYYDLTWNDVYNYVLYTRGGPYWQVARIPLSKFYFAYRGRIQDRQQPVPLDRVSSFSITAARCPGTFSLEVDYIGLEYDPEHTEEFAYEMYQLPQFLVGQ